MEQEYCTYKCEKCGTEISYTDSWESGFRDNDDVNIKCRKCGNVQEHKINGTISGIEGGEEVF